MVGNIEVRFVSSFFIFVVVKIFDFLFVLESSELGFNVYGNREIFIFV